MAITYNIAYAYFCLESTVVMDEFKSRGKIDIKDIKNFYMTSGRAFHEVGEYELHGWNSDRTRIINDESLKLESGARIIFVAKEYAIGDYNQKTIDNTKTRDIYESNGGTFHSTMNCYR
ncbi:hypothetical protein GGI03_000446 [Coemansia sp. RSA 2337]|nr:hypothetical protein LPJ71_000797 [Coemansia sp. S17]KAJ2018189.1 hypothetical protein GGI14_002477 [Coemansia sp. S680]KAJ2106003.1 hypothetical protein GGI16_002109 [Coemansia sp. S142-1]KAJ2426482.1 hypothetical protein GGF41_002040 [Coemansia sp. RSA 2531]KAJ2469324.1 hypothetical protein GGI03_000446 [Coemansia sp. RSA 2337]